MAKFKSQYSIELSNNQKPCIKNILTFANLHMVISTKKAPKPYIETLLLKISRPQC